MQFPWDINERRIGSSGADSEAGRYSLWSTLARSKGTRWFTKGGGRRGQHSSFVRRYALFPNPNFPRQRETRSMNRRMRYRQPQAEGGRRELYLARGVLLFITETGGTAVIFALPKVITTDFLETFKYTSVFKTETLIPLNLLKVHGS